MSPVPSDRDELIAPVRRVAGSSSPNCPRDESGFGCTWGLIGTSHRIDALVTIPGQMGVIRILPNSVRYTRPPVGPGWTEVPGHVGQYEMAWPGNPATARSLDDIASEFRRTSASHSGNIPATDPIAAHFDSAIQALLDRTADLAAQGWGVGLLTPAGVMFDLEGPRLEPVLVDLGFTWTGEFGPPPWDQSPGKPEWLIRPEAAPIWARPPADQQFAAPKGSPFGPIQEAETVVTLARLITCLLAGTPHLPPERLTDSPVAEILRSANQGDYATIRSFQAALKTHRPSEHFAEPLPLTGVANEKSGSRLYQRLAIVGVILAVVALLGFLAWPGSQPSTENGTTIATTPTTGTTPGDPEGAPSGPLSPPERQKQSARWQKQCDDLLNSLERQPARRGEIGHALRKLVNDQTELSKQQPLADDADKTKERQWLAYYDDLALQLGWPR